MNFMEGELVQKGDGYVVETLGTTVPVSAGIAAQLKAAGVESRPVIMGIRPEHVVLAKSADTATITANIDVSEMMGSEVHLHVTTAEGKELVVRIPSTEISEEQRSSQFSGEVKLNFPGDLIHLFDPETEENLLHVETEAEAASKAE